MVKKELKIKQRLTTLENGSFNEDDIKLLLIEIREKLKSETFLREICDFIAHSNRDRGICHKKVDVRYAKFKLVEENTKKILTPDFIEKNKTKPERFFTDAMLSYIQPEKIKKDLFELLILSGIDDIDNELFLKYYKLNKKQVKSLVTKAYKLYCGNYIPKTTLSQTDFTLLNDLLKFIRGTITGKPAFTEKEIINDFNIGLKRLCAKINYRADFDKIEKNKDDIIVCIISLLDDSTFKLFDGTNGIGFISVHPRDNDPEICLMSHTGKYTLPLISTEIKARNYIDCERDEIMEYEFKKLPWNNCIRNESNKLKLMKYEI